MGGVMILRRAWRRVFGVVWVCTDLRTGEVMERRSWSRVTPRQFSDGRPHRFVDRESRS
jgi:hypothetical protein